MDFLFGGGGAHAISLVAAADVSSRSSSPAAAVASSASLVSSTTTPAHSHSASSSSASYSSSSATTSLLEATQASSAAAEAATAAISGHFNGHDNGPILYSDSNRTSAIDDIRSIVIYIFIFSVFLCFFLILPGIRNEKLPTFFCIAPSLLVTSIIILSLMGTTWHVGEAPISAPYKAFSRDRIQGDLSVRIGLQSVNISLKAHKYYLLHSTDGPMIMENMPAVSLLATMAGSDDAGGHSSAEQQSLTSTTIKTAPSSNQQDQDNAGKLKENNFVEYATAGDQSSSGAASSFISDTQSSARPGEHDRSNQTPLVAANGESLADELLVGRTSDGILVDTELDTDEVFSESSSGNSNNNNNGRQSQTAARRATRSSSLTARSKRQHQQQQQPQFRNQSSRADGQSASGEANNVFQKYTIKRVYVDINYNERFYWISPVQMRHEYHQALERGLPYPILTVVEYLAQDDAGFNWSRQYRLAGYYTTMLLWLSASMCVLMFCLHCAAPKYGVYAMQLLGCLLLLTNLTYATLVPKGDQKLVIPFEGQSLSFRFGWNFWLVLVGGCLSLFVGTVIVIIDNLFPNFIFTTVLDADFDSQQNYYQRKHKILGKSTNLLEEDANDNDEHSSVDSTNVHEKPKLPPFMLSKVHVKKRRTSRVKQEPNESNESKLIEFKQISTNAGRAKRVHDKEVAASDDQQLANLQITDRDSYLPTSENKYSSRESVTRRTIVAKTLPTQDQSRASRDSQSDRDRLGAISSAIDNRDIESREESAAVNTTRPGTHQTVRL